MKNFILQKTCRSIVLGQDLPPFYYGFAYWDYCDDSGYFTIIPFNYLLRLYKFINYRWNRFRSKRGWFEKQVEAAVKQRLHIYEMRMESYKNTINVLQNIITK